MEEYDILGKMNVHLENSHSFKIKGCTLREKDKERCKEIKRERDEERELEGNRGDTIGEGNVSIQVGLRTIAI